MTRDRLTDSVENMRESRAKNLRRLHSILQRSTPIHNCHTSMLSAFSVARERNTFVSSCTSAILFISANLEGLWGHYTKINQENQPSLPRRQRVIKRHFYVEITQLCPVKKMRKGWAYIGQRVPACFKALFNIAYTTHPPEGWLLLAVIVQLIVISVKRR